MAHKGSRDDPAAVVPTKGPEYIRVYISNGSKGGMNEGGAQEISPNIVEY